jgi:RHS repeat-associated protein
MLMTDETGQTVWEGEYLPFGAPHSVTGNITNNFRFPGQYFDAETALNYNWYRYYNEKIGRYISFDPILHLANRPPKIKKCPQSDSYPTFDVIKETPQKLNPFVYVEGNPTNLLDPMGLASCGSGWKKILVPDNWFGWYSFTKPCSNHDDCYGCEGAKAKKSRHSCDSEFFRNMRDVCSSLQRNSYWQNHCEGTAYTYYKYVVKNGKKYFDAARKDCCKK